MIRALEIDEKRTWVRPGSDYYGIVVHSKTLTKNGFKGKLDSPNEVEDFLKDYHGDAQLVLGELWHNDKQGTYAYYFKSAIVESQFKSLGRSGIR